MPNTQSLTRPLQNLVSRAALAILACLTIVSWSPDAVAKGRIVWKKTTINENTKRESWYLEMEIHLGRSPDVAYVPMKFEFEPIAHYERSLVDGREEPLERTVPLSNQQAIIESTEVGFLDAGTGVIQSRTRFSFKVTRAHDFEAGEYKVTVKDGRDGSTVGVPTTLKFIGENPVVDRRSIVFTGSKKKEKKKEEPSSAEGTEEADDGPGDFGEGFEDEDEPGEGNEPPPVEERPGGGCHHGPSHGAPWGWLLVVGMVLLAFARMRGERSS